ncbi:MAG: hypothetical protein H0V23_00015 [Nocardioidaceae bacterium]|nr:hypothetical protein [Nocardioidaceae bacterium]
MALSDRALRRSAWAAWWFFATMFTLAVLLSLRWGSGDELGFVVVIAGFPFVGLLILRRQPRNTIGWLLQGIGFVWGLGGLADNYARYGLLVDPGSLPGPDVAMGLIAGIWAPGIGLMGTFLILLYPDGHLPTPRWRPVAWLSAVTILVLFVVVDLSPGKLQAGPVPTLPNPLGVESARPVLDVLLAVLLPLLALCIVGCAVALVRRFRRSRGIERLQLKWLATAGALVASLFVLSIALSLLSQSTSTGPQPDWLTALDAIGGMSFLLLPVAIGISILRHGLYEIDVVINRALVYGSLSATLAGVYLGLVLLLQLVLSPLTDQSDLAVAGSTLAVAALFRPARARIQSLVDRRFYRSRYDAARTLEAFAGQLRHELDLEAVGTDLRTAVRDTVQPEHVSLWLRPEVRRP